MESSPEVPGRQVADTPQGVEGMLSVCAPGGSCVASPLFPPPTGICTCRKADVGNAHEIDEDHLIPCQAGGICLQIGGDALGYCVALP